MIKSRFAWLPTRLCTGKTVWLEGYYSVQMEDKILAKIPRRIISYSWTHEFPSSEGYYLVKTPTSRGDIGVVHFDVFGCLNGMVYDYGWKDLCCVEEENKGYQYAQVY